MQHCCTLPYLLPPHTPMAKPIATPLPAATTTRLPFLRFLRHGHSSTASPQSPLLLPPQSRNLSCSSSSSSSASTSKPPPPAWSLISDGRDASAAGSGSGRPVCPGCGVFMQDADPDLPGYFQSPSRRLQEPASEEELGEEEPGLDAFLDWEEEEEGGGDEGSSPKSDLAAWESDWEEHDDEEERWRKELDGFTLPGVGYGGITEETLEEMRKAKVSKSEKKRRMREAKKSSAGAEGGAVVCARCHSLRNYGHVKNHKADNLIPDFDFDRLISARLMRPATSAPVVVIVVDCADFDGSFPRRAAESLFAALEGSKRDARLSKLPRLVLVGTKVDLLPSQVSGARLDRWVRHRAKAAGAPKLSAVYLVSAHKDLGVRNLVSYIKELAGPRGNVWVIGAQNAGKSTLINAFAKRRGVKITKLTEAAVPGTTLGIVRITGILPAKAKMYDTPGLLHPYLMTMRLTREEQKMVEIRKQLQPRTFRVKVGQSVHFGGLARLDLLQASVETIYVSVWASPCVSLHLGKTENAEELRDKHFGIRLQPPIGKERVAELGDWRERRVEASGSSWDVNSMDIAIAGIGWYSLGLKGQATVALWTSDGVDVTPRDPLVLDRARFLEKPGFWLPEGISNAIGEESRRKTAERKRLEEAGDLLLEATT